MSSVTAARIHLDDLVNVSGLELPASSWREVTQEHIDLFAEATGDDQWIHCDRERAAAGPFGGTIAHGYLTLSLIPIMLTEVLEIDGKSSGVNYGLDRVRFTSPVPSGASVRLCATVDRAEPKAGGVQYWVDMVIEIRGAAKPAAVGRCVVLALP